MHKIVYLPLAESDLMDALGYIAYTLDAPKAARDLLAEFDETVQRIAEFPYAHELYRTERDGTAHRGVPLRSRAIPNRSPDERRDPQGAGQELRALLCCLSRPRGDSSLSLRQERQKQNR